MKKKFEKKGNRGIYSIPGMGVCSFEITGVHETCAVQSQEYRQLYKSHLADNSTMIVGDAIVACWGEGHNLYPNEVYDTISDNKLLPELMSKQAEFLFGKGPMLYRTEIVGEGENAKVKRIPVQDPAIEAWLDSWEAKGYNHYWDYLINIIKDYYHVVCYFTEFKFNKARRLVNSGIPTASLPIAALQYVGSESARLATFDQSVRFRRLKDEDMTHVVVADWLAPGRSEAKVYPRFNMANPFAYGTAISFVKSKTFTRNIYPQNEWFKGLFEWIKASNLSPRYINSFLENALNAFIHVEIPGSWMEREKDKIQQICNQNMTGYGDLIADYEGVRLLDKSNQPIMYCEQMIDIRIKFELRKITTMLSGKGKNQGKLWASTKWGEDGWTFKDFPGKYKEFMDSVIAYDKRADQVILAGKGINSSISNVENDGVISKSGSDVYYNYMIYQNALVIDEYIVTRDINRAIQLNFPHAKGISLGFRMEIPAKQQETTPSDRLENTVGK